MGNASIRADTTSSVTQMQQRNVGTRNGRPLAKLGGVRAFVAAVLVASCASRAESGHDQSGAIFVVVRNGLAEAVAGASVSTEPASLSLQTDGAGSALIPDVTPGFYKVIASDGAASASDAVEVVSGEVTRVSLVLRTGTTVSTGGTSSGGATSRGGSIGNSTGGSVSRGGSSSGGTTTAKGGSTAQGGSSVDPDLEYIDVGTQVEAMRTDPTRPYLYAVDRVNNNLLFVNLESKKLEKTLFVGSSPVDLALSLDASELYIANFGSTQIAVVDLETQEVGRDLFVDTSLGIWDGNPYRLVATANDTLVFTSEDQWNDLKLVNAQNGGSIAATGSVYQPDLEASPDGKYVFVAESGSTGSKLIRFEVTDTTLKQIDESPTAANYGSRAAILSGDGKYAFYATSKILTSNLQSVLGTFAETIYAANEDGSIAVGSTRVFNGNTFAVLGSLPVSTQVMALSADKGSVYLYDTKSSKIAIVDLSKY